MPRKTGFLANLDNVPPLVFRFQFNPELLSDKKTYQYDPVEFSGRWSFEEAGKAKGVGKTLLGIYRDLKAMGPTLINTKELRGREGDQRTIQLEFQLDASEDLPVESQTRIKGDLEPQFAVLRSFMYPGYPLEDLPEVLGATGLARPPKTPPECDLVYAGIRLTCVMTDLNIKMVGFNDDGKPVRAEVSVTLKEQTNSISPIADYLGRLVQASKALMGLTVEEIAIASPIGRLFE
ncbi:MAG: hypothetical protein HY741_05800 [Chloroflexi bacterium]|nr:hypothetical protein [Chloroflexota bacterium]